METRKRKPLSDITNAYNLLQTSPPRKLVATSPGANSFSKRQVSILKSNSSSKNQKLGFDSSNRSDPSIGSSNVSAAGNSRTVQFRTPPRAISSIASQGGIGSKDAAYNLRQTIQKSKKDRDAAPVFVSPNPVEKREDNGKAIAAPFSLLPPDKMKNNQIESGKGIPDSYSRLCEKIEKQKETLSSSGCSVEKQGEIAKGILDHSSVSNEKRNNGKREIFMPSGSSSAKRKEMGKEFVIPSSFSVERTKEKEKPSNPSSREKTREKGKAILQPFDIVELTKYKGLSDDMTVYSQPPRKKNEKRKKGAGASSCPPVSKTKNMQNNLNEAGDIKTSMSWNDPHPKCRKKRCSRIETTSELPLDFIEQQRAYFKEVDEFELPVEEISQDES